MSIVKTTSTNHVIERLDRLEDLHNEQLKNFAVHEEADRAAFSSIKKDLGSIENKVDKITDAVSQQHDLWVASQASDSTKKSRIKLWLAILGVIASSGVIETVMHHVLGH